MQRILTTIIVTAALATGALAGEPSSPIDPARMSAAVKVLASDAFQGRAPGTAGEAKTVAYLVEQFQALGLQPGVSTAAGTNRSRWCTTSPACRPGSRYASATRCISW